jgi:DNA replication licensing factor MCM3
MAAAAAENAARDQYEEKVRFFSSFLHSNRDDWEKTIDTALANGNNRLKVDLRDLDKQEPGLSRKVLSDPVNFILPWEDAVFNFLREINEKAMKGLRQPLKLNLQGAFGRNLVNPRGINSAVMHQLMCVEGVVTKAGLSEPKLTSSIHLRKSEDGNVTMRDQRDSTAFVDQPFAGAMPTNDSDGHEIAIEIGLSAYKDQQKFTLQEAPEHTPAGQIPRTVEVICDGELADVAKPGERVQVTGVYRGFPPGVQDFTTGVWPARLISTNVQGVKELDEAPFVTMDVRHIKELAERPDAFQVLARSFAPSICGHEKVKAGLLLQMIGGTEKNLDNGTHLRGDINVLLVGDPSCGKSQMLRFVMNTAPLAVSTTGRGSSGVGLTAAMVKDAGSRDFHLEAGAMVLADRGVICIDEFDKMGEDDRTAIHEAMEQQCVTISKAGMHVSLNSRCSVTAAANPIYGTFDPSLTLAKNLGLPDSLLSRFDLIYIVRDLTDEEIDRRIATQVLNQARGRTNEFRRSGVEQVHSSILERRQQTDRNKNQEPTEVFEKRGDADGDGDGHDVLTVEFLRKYIRYCKRLTPALSEAAQEVVAAKYVDMRMRFQSGFSGDMSAESKAKPRLAVTVRTLEALIRLATAHAKLKLRRDDVLPEDVEEAYKLMLGAREEDIPSPIAEVAIADEPGDDDDVDGADGARGKKRARRGGAADKDSPAKKSPKKKGGISKERFRVMEVLVGRTFARAEPLNELQRGDLFESVNSELEAGEEPFDNDEFEAGLAKLEAANKIFTSDSGDVTLVA